MANMTILLLIYVDVVIALGLYAYLRKKKKLIGFQLGMNISIVMGGMSALLSGVLLIQQYPFHFTWITIISALTGMMAGALFGILFDYQTFVTGLTNGMLVGVMSPMIGTVIDMPFIFNCFIHVFFVFILLTILTSIKRS
ncbi:hypothetical protein [Paenisporosarcina sp. TG-14]|uniref:hypothetical protein n=1 Tax=Paenisporosarcina sp. TG-14 TaxID=1231057 RepID=UPI00031E6FC2|nr:hypothetical protein [Paenisporosarcina sp. TG-14]